MNDDTNLSREVLLLDLYSSSRLMTDFADDGGLEGMKSRCD